MLHLWWRLVRRRRRRRPGAGPDPWREFRIALAALGAVLAVGTVGYHRLGLSTFDAVYQTAITITTVGYGEVGAHEENATSYRAFTLGLVLVGASTAVYTVGVLLETLVQGTVNDGLRRRRMNKRIERMEGHVIVAGWGRVGHSIAQYALRHGAEVVIVDQQEIESDGLPYVVGDAHDDDTLLDAGLERASVLIAALDTDSANLALTLTARSLRKDLFLVARTAKQSNERKFFQAGADRVVNPHEIGGSRMGALAMHPTVAEFLDEVLHDDGHDVEIVEITVVTGSPAIGEAVGSLAADDGRAMVIAIRRADGSYVANPPVATLLAEDDVLIALGSHDEVRDLRMAVARRRTMLFRGNEVRA